MHSQEASSPRRLLLLSAVAALSICLIGLLLAG
jgi:hypothetical protein